MNARYISVSAFLELSLPNVITIDLRSLAYLLCHSIAGITNTCGMAMMLARAPWNSASKSH